jgi:hypothetical protein
MIIFAMRKYKATFATERGAVSMKAPVFVVPPHMWRFISKICARAHEEMRVATVVRRTGLNHGTTSSTMV